MTADKRARRAKTAGGVVNRMRLFALCASASSGVASERAFGLHFGLVLFRNMGALVALCVFAGLVLAGMRVGLGMSRLQVGGFTMALGLLAVVWGLYQLDEAATYDERSDHISWGANCRHMPIKYSADRLSRTQPDNERVFGVHSAAAGIRKHPPETLSHTDSGHTLGRLLARTTAARAALGADSAILLQSGPILRPALQRLPAPPLRRPVSTRTDCCASNRPRAPQAYEACRPAGPRLRLQCTRLPVRQPPPTERGYLITKPDVIQAILAAMVLSNSCFSASPTPPLHPRQLTQDTANGPTAEPACGDAPVRDNSPNHTLQQATNLEVARFLT